MIRNLATRDLQPELMDQPDLPDDSHRQALAGLARTNTLAGSSRPLWKRIRRLPAADGSLSKRSRSKLSPSKLSLCDIASGAGDVAVSLCRRAKRDGVKLRVTGYDISPVAVETAQSRAQAAGIRGARFEVRDVLTCPPESLGRFDVVTCSLFLHHLTNDQAVELLKRMARMARRLVLVCDLKRGRLGYAAAQVVTQLVSRSEVVHSDGPQSVAAAFTLDEARGLARRAGMAGAEIYRAWPFRYLIAWEPAT
jgi:2-polyprenyl-3-methyl-5-hydroxy-6-metoxy-1,4-benzoquinol methylase